MAEWKVRNVGSRNGMKSGELPFVGSGYDTEAEALAGLLGSSAVPSVFDGKPRINADCYVEPLDDGKTWLGYARYASADYLTGARPPGEFSYAFDISGTSQRIYQARRTVQTYNRPGSFVSRNFHGLIGVNEDGSVEGCDIIVPATIYRFSRVFNESIFDSGTYIRTLILAVGSVNTDTFQGLLAGEGLITGISGRPRSDKKWQLDFVIAVNPNETLPPIGTDESDPLAITGVAKKGWEYVWTYYITTRESIGGGQYAKVKVPVAVTVCEVYRKTAYAALAIDTGTDPGETP